MSDYDKNHDYIKLWLKNYVKEKSENSIFMYKFETFNELLIYPLNVQVDKLNQEILRFSNMLNSGYPFISYNFKEGVFDEDYYFDMHVSTIFEVLSDTYNIKDFKVILKEIKPLLSKAISLLEDDNSKFCKVITEIKTDYCRSKFIDALTTKRQEILENKEKYKSDIINGDLNIDLSNTKDINKVRYLIELGVVDYLHKNIFSHSNNALASALSGVTGLKVTTLQPYINAYLTNSLGKNNPMNNTNEVNKIILTLNKLGYSKPK